VLLVALLTRWTHSETRPVPTIANFEREQEQRRRVEDEPIVSRPSMSRQNSASKNPAADASGAQQKQDIMKRSLGKTNPQQRLEEQRKKGPQAVKDPVTGQQVIVRDARFEGMCSIRASWNNQLTNK